MEKKEENLNTEEVLETEESKIAEETAEDLLKTEGQEEGEKKKSESQETKEEPEKEFEIDGRKYTVSELRKAIQGGLREEDYSRKMEALKEERKQLQDFIDSVEILKQSPKKFRKFLELLSEKETPEEETDEEEKKIFEGLDETDPYSRVMRNLYKMVRSLSDDVRGFKEKERALDYEAQVSEVRQVLKKTLDDAEKDFKFEGDEEKKFWRDSVLSYLKDNPKNYGDMEDLISTVRKVSKLVAEKINRMGEQRLKKYIESKSGPTPPGPGGSGMGPVPKKISFENLQEGIEAALEEAMSEKS